MSDDIARELVAEVLAATATDGNLQPASQYVASAIACSADGDPPTMFTILATFMAEVDHLMHHQNEIWPELMPGPPKSNKRIRDLVECFFQAHDQDDALVRLSEEMAGTLSQRPLKPPNIKLDYPVTILIDNNLFWANECELFMDEHNIQWVKFFPKNGRHIGAEHILRTDHPSFGIVRQK